MVTITFVGVNNTVTWTTIASSVCLRDNAVTWILNESSVCEVNKKFLLR